MDAGEEAYKGGRPFWDNPHVEGYSYRMDFYAWFAGWCKAAKEDNGRLVNFTK